MKITAGIIIVASALAVMVTATASWGKCEEKRLVDHFSLEKYTGLWYEQFRDKCFMPEKGDCQESRYAQMEGKRNQMFILHSQYKNNKTGFDTISGVGNCKGAHCEVKFKWFLPEGDYRILDTDYQTYSIVYSCRTLFGVAKKEYVWLLTRE